MFLGPSGILARIAGRETEGEQRYKAYVPLQLESMTGYGLVDSGNSVGTAMSWEFAQVLGLTKADLEEDPHLRHAKTAKDNVLIEVLGRPKKKLKLRLGGIGTHFKVRPLVVRGLSHGLQYFWSILGTSQDRSLAFKECPQDNGQACPTRLA